MVTRNYWEEVSKVRGHKVVDFCRKDLEGKDIKIAMVTMTQEESLATSINTEKFVRKFFKDSETDLPKTGEAANGYTMIFEQKAAVEILFKVCRNPDDISLAFFKTPDEMTRTLTTDEIGYLMTVYSRVRAELSPFKYDITEDEVDALIDRIDMEKKVYILDTLSPSVLGDFILSLVTRLKATK